MAMSESSTRWMRIDSSGERNTREPSTGEAKLTPSSLIRRRSASENTWKPPESVRIGLSQPIMRSRPQEQVERVAEDDLGADVAQRSRRHRLDRAVRADRHEGRRLDRAARQRDAAAARGAGGGEQVEFH